jgi:hypothetical protein
MDMNYIGLPGKGMFQGWDQIRHQISGHFPDGTGVSVSPQAPTSIDGVPVFELNLGQAFEMSGLDPNAMPVFCQPNADIFRHTPAATTHGRKFIIQYKYSHNLSSQKRFVCGSLH